MHRFASLSITALLLCPASQAASPVVQNAISLETHLLVDASDGRLERFSLVEASLIAGGVDTHVPG